LAAKCNKYLTYLKLSQFFIEKRAIRNVYEALCTKPGLIGNSFGNINQKNVSLSNLLLYVVNGIMTFFIKFVAFHGFMCAVLVERQLMQRPFFSEDFMEFIPLFIHRFSFICAPSSFFLT